MAMPWETNVILNIALEEAYAPITIMSHLFWKEKLDCFPHKR